MLALQGVNMVKDMVPEALSELLKEPEAKFLLNQT